jgi:translin
MERSTANLEAIAQAIRSNFATKDVAREKALRLGREIIRHSAAAIRAAHRGDFDESSASLNTARNLVEEMKETLTPYNDLRNAGFAHDSQKEYAEGRITLALMKGNIVPDPEELGVTDAAYLHGLAEAVGEMRRHLLDGMRSGDLSRCEELLANMDDIYGMLLTMDFTDALTYGLRRATDVTRGILEKTRSELTLIVRQRELEQKIQAYMEREQGLQS